MAVVIPSWGFTFKDLTLRNNPTGGLSRIHY